MKTAPKISIIIPVYNVEQYLRQCLDSIMNQTMGETQIICVNDGSPDDSRAILQEYADRDARIEIIDKPNGGISSARNAAYPLIRGTYTLFVDSDDWIAPELCEKTYRKAEETGATVVFFFDHRRSEKMVQSIAHNDRTTLKEKLPLLDFPAAWNKLWRTDFLLDNKLYFPEGLSFEDNLVNWQAVTKAKKIAIVPERLYYYRRNPGSTMQTRGVHSLDMVPIYEKIREYLLESGFYADYRDKFIAMKLDVWFRHYRNLPASLQSRYIEMIREVLSEDDREFYRTAPETQCKKIVKLFYAMIDGNESDAWKFRIVYTMQQIVRMPELLIRQWIARPIRQLQGGNLAGTPVLLPLAKYWTIS